MGRGSRWPSAHAPEPGTVVADPSRLGQGWRASALGWEPVALDGHQSCHGYASPSGRAMLALYATGGTLCLQAGSAAWDCSTIASARLVSARFRSTDYELRFHDGTTAQVRAQVPFRTALGRLADPGFDPVDTWWDDLLRLLPIGAGDVSAWARSEYERWHAGFRHSLDGALTSNERVHRSS